LAPKEPGNGVKIKRKHIFIRVVQHVQNDHVFDPILHKNKTFV
jgi:ribosomal protein L20A (L18A)